MRFDQLTTEEQERCVDSYEAGFAAGCGRPWLVQGDDELYTFLDAVAEAWWRRLETMQAVSRVEEKALLPSQIPEWLRAYAERQALEMRDG